MASKGIFKNYREISQMEVMKKIEKGGVNSAEEYELIIENLQLQGLRLMKDRQQLKIRVQLLLEKQNQLLEEHRSKGSKNPLVDYTRLKLQLEKKHKQLQVCQKKCYSSINKGALSVQVKEYINKCAVVQNQIEKFSKTLKDQKKIQKKLQKAIKSQLRKINRNVPQKEDLQQENRQLKRIIWNLKIQADLTSHVDVRLHNSIVRLESKKKIIQKLKTMTIQQIRREQAKTKMQTIEQDMKLRRANSVRKSFRVHTQGRVQSAKSGDVKLTLRQNLMKQILEKKKMQQEKAQKQKEQNAKMVKEKEEQRIQEERIKMERLEMQAKLSQMNYKQKQKKVQFKQQSIKNLQKQEGTLDKQIYNLRNEQMNWNEKLAHVRQKVLQKLNAKKPKIKLSDAEIQVNIYEDQNPLPLQMIGNQTWLLQDDRNVLRGSKDTLITGLIVYQNKVGISCIKALYSNGKQTNCFIPQKYLAQKCLQKKIMLSDPMDYIKWIKTYYDRIQNKLVRLQVYSNNKIKFEIGKQKQLMLKNIITYKFDNNMHEVPVCLRVSYRTLEEHWVVASMGVEINEK